MINKFKYLTHVVVFWIFIFIIEYGSICRENEKCNDFSTKQFSHYQTVYIYIITALQLFILLAMPQIICNILGLTFFNPFPGEIAVNQRFRKDNSNNSINSKDVDHKPPVKAFDAPHFCFRVVTRGLFPELVQDNVRRNLLTCIESGLEDFSIEVVTDKEIYLGTSDPRIRELVVPSSYKTSTGAMFKARALQYALEDNMSPVKRGDYIVHLDEETMLTRNSINGIINFALDGVHAFGQGLITYANLEIVNIFTTLADSYRVADDMGKLRFQLAFLHRPLFGWKGSYVVTKYEAEKDVSFDHGPDGSIAEDCYFSMIAYKKGYTFDFIMGEMCEKSPFTLMDLVRQRKRWIQGILLVIKASEIPIKIKSFLIFSLLAWLTSPLITLSFVFSTVLALPSAPWLQPFGSLCLAVTLYMYFFGLLKSFDLKNRPAHLIVAYLVGQLCTLPVNIVVENVAVIWGLVTPKHNFYIVKKDILHKPILSP